MLVVVTVASATLAPHHRPPLPLLEKRSFFGQQRNVQEEYSSVGLGNRVTCVKIPCFWYGRPLLGVFVDECAALARPPRNQVYQCLPDFSKGQKEL